MYVAQTIKRLYMKLKELIEEENKLNKQWKNEKNKYKKDILKIRLNSKRFDIDQLELTIIGIEAFEGRYH